ARAAARIRSSTTGGRTASVRSHINSSSSFQSGEGMAFTPWLGGFTGRLHVGSDGRRLAQFLENPSTGRSDATDWYVEYSTDLRIRVRRVMRKEQQELTLLLGQFGESVPQHLMAFCRQQVTVDIHRLGSLQLGAAQRVHRHRPVAYALLALTLVL